MPSTRSRRVSRRASRSSRRRTARRRRPRWRADPRARARLAWNNSGANLASGVTSTLLAADDAELGLLEVDEFALPEVDATHPPARRLPRQPVPRPARPLRRARAHRGALARRRRRARPHGALVANADDPLVAALADGRETTLLFGVDDPRRARAGLQHASDSKYCIRCGPPYRYDAAYVGHLGAYRCERAGTRGPPLDVAARDIEPQGLDGVSFALHAPDGRRVSVSPSRGSTTSTTRSRAASLAFALGVALDDVVGGLDRFRAAFGRFERFTVGDRGFLLLLVKNPAGANEALRTLEEGGVSPTLVVALNDRIADGRDVSWIWDVDFEPVLERAERIVVSGERAAELALRFTYAGLPARAARARARPRRRARPRARADTRGRRARRPADLHGDARAPGDRDRARPHPAVLGA